MSDGPEFDPETISGLWGDNRGAYWNVNLTKQKRGHVGSAERVHQNEIKTMFLKTGRDKDLWLGSWKLSSVTLTTAIWESMHEERVTRCWFRPCSCDAPCASPSEFSKGWVCFTRHKS